MRIQSLNHSKYQHQYHIVWGTKYRRKFLKPYVKQAFLDSLYSSVRAYPTLYIHAVNIDNDHVHLQIDIPPNIRVSDAVQMLKSRSSRHLKSQFAFIQNMYLTPSIWSVGYFSSTIGINEQVIQNYIQNQSRQEQSVQAGFEFE